MILSIVEDDEIPEESVIDSSDVKASFYSPKVEDAFKKLYPGK